MPGILVHSLMSLMTFGKINGYIEDHDGIEYLTLNPGNKESTKTVKNTNKYRINLILLVAESGLFKDN